MRNLKSMRVGRQIQEFASNKILEKLGKQLEENFNRTLREINPHATNESYHQSDLSFKSHRGSNLGIVKPAIFYFIWC